MFIYISFIKPSADGATGPDISKRNTDPSLLFGLQPYLIKPGPILSGNINPIVLLIIGNPVQDIRLTT